MTVCPSSFDPRFPRLRFVQSAFATRSMKIRFASIVVVLLLTGTYLKADDAKTESQPVTKEPPLLTVDEAQVSLIQNAFIAAPMAGVVAKVDVSEGQKVEAGTRLVLLSDEQAKTELEAAKAAFEAARLASANDVDQRYAQRTLEVRQRELQQSEIANSSFRGTVSATELEKLRLVVDQSRLAIEQAEHDLLVARANAAEKKAAVRIAEERLKKHGIETTVAGMVTEVDVEAGEWVEAGKPIVRVISLNPIRIECFVDGHKHGMELVGKSVTFEPRLPAKDEKPLRGKVTFVSPELDAVTGQVRLWATIENPNYTVRAGMFGKLIIDSK